MSYHVVIVNEVAGFLDFRSNLSLLNTSTCTYAIMPKILRFIIDLFPTLDFFWELEVERTEGLVLMRYDIVFIASAWKEALGKTSMKSHTPSSFAQGSVHPLSNTIQLRSLKDCLHRLVNVLIAKSLKAPAAIFTPIVRMNSLPKA